MMRRALDALNGLLAVAILVGAGIAWPQLPETIPAHFGVDGRPDRWTGTTPLSWFSLPVAGVACWLLILWMRAWMVRRPERINLPSGQRLLDLPEEVRPAVVEHMRFFLAVVGLEVLVIFGLLLVGNVRAAAGGDPQGVILGVLAIGLLSSPVLLVVFVLGLQRATRR